MRLCFYIAVVHHLKIRILVKEAVQPLRQSLSVWRKQMVSESLGRDVLMLKPYRAVVIGIPVLECGVLLYAPRNVQMLCSMTYFQPLQYMLPFISVSIKLSAWSFASVCRMSESVKCHLLLVVFPCLDLEMMHEASLFTCSVLLLNFVKVGLSFPPPDAHCLKYSSLPTSTSLE